MNSFSWHNASSLDLGFPVLNDKHWRSFLACSLFVFIAVHEGVVRGDRGDVVDPIIDVVNLLEMVKTGDRNLETVLGELNYEDDKEIFATDRFYSSYKYHKLILEMSPTAGQKQIDALMDYVNNNPAPGEQSGREGLKTFAGYLRSAFPDIHFLLEDQVAEGDKVVTRWTVTGTQRGEFAGIPRSSGECSLEPLVVESQLWDAHPWLRHHWFSCCIRNPD